VDVVVGAATAAGESLQRRLSVDVQVKKTTLAIKRVELKTARANLAIKETDLETARVSLAIKRTDHQTGCVKLAIARVGLVAAIVGVLSALVLLFGHLKVGRDRERAPDVHAATEEHNSGDPDIVVPLLNVGAHRYRKSTADRRRLEVRHRPRRIVDRTS